MGIKAAILGAGYMGIGHAKRLKETGVQIQCICDTSTKARALFMEELKDDSVKEYADFDEMLLRETFEVLFICLPPFAQDGQFEKAAEKGIHIFIEKPIALDSETGKRMTEAAKKHHIITQVGFHMRQGAAVKKLKEMILSERAGRPVLFHGNFACNSLHSPWWRNRDLCGGQVFEQAIHIYDMCRNLMGDPCHVTGLMGNLCHSGVNGYTIEDVSVSISGFINGALASITADNCEIPGGSSTDFKVVYEHVTADFTDHNHAVFSYTSEQPVRTETIVSDQDPYMEEVKEFIACVENGRDTACNITEGYKSLCYVEKVVESARLSGAKMLIR